MASPDPSVSFVIDQLTLRSGMLCEPAPLTAVIAQASASKLIVSPSLLRPRATRAIESIGAATAAATEPTSTSAIAIENRIGLL